MSMETWLPVPKFAGRYEVSDRGDVRSVTRHDEYIDPRKGTACRRLIHGKPLTPTPDRYGRIYVDLRDGVAAHRVYVHRLVLSTFIGECPPGMEACHNDGNFVNNRVANLRWDTHANNIADKVKHGTESKGSARPLAKLHETDIPVIRELASAGVLHRDIAKRYGVCRELIGQIARGQKWRHV